MARAAPSCCTMSPVGLETLAHSHPRGLFLAVASQAQVIESRFTTRPSRGTGAEPSGHCFPFLDYWHRALSCIKRGESVISCHCFMAGCSGLDFDFHFLCKPLTLWPSLVSCAANGHRPKRGVSGVGP